ncbi:MAG TPA: IS110 family transposase [Candidatus Limnocylindrales bacterium]|nr:IS110 family transposase [Candidatus Limnocylindrales bacterium]
MTITMIGLDTAKAVFQVHAVDKAGNVVIRRKIQRKDLITFFEKQEATTVVMEACGASHHWGRTLAVLGHDVKLIAPEAVKPFVKKGKKNDAADAAAICTAAHQAEMKFVPVKTMEQQAILAVHTARALLVKQQTMLANAVRSLASEFGLTVPKGIGNVEGLAEQVEEEKSLPEEARQVAKELKGRLSELVVHIGTLETKIVRHARNDARARRLATIPGIGPITASLIAATVADFSVFKNARQFAAWLGLVPRQHSTAGKTRLGRITKAGNSEIRRLLVLGATAMLKVAGQWNSVAGAWFRGVLERRPARLATVALANKTARIIWALMTHNEVYRPSGRSAQPQARAAV